jgi:cold shock CspA family protein
MDSVDNVSFTVLPNKVLTGCVKWFNNSLNYGFITVLTEGEYLNLDVFSHQTNIKTKHNCFRTLYTGECVQFELAKSDNTKHPYHAVNISGFNGGMLHCENPNYRQTNGTKTFKSNNANNGFERSNSVRGDSNQESSSFRGRSDSTRGGSVRGGSMRGGSVRGGSTRGGSTRGDSNISTSQ